MDFGWIDVIEYTLGEQWIWYWHHSFCTASCMHVRRKTKLVRDLYKMRICSQMGVCAWEICLNDNYLRCSTTSMQRRTIILQCLISVTSWSVLNVFCCTKKPCDTTSVNWHVLRYTYAICESSNPTPADTRVGNRKLSLESLTVSVRRKRASRVTHGRTSMPLGEKQTRR